MLGVQITKMVGITFLLIGLAIAGPQYVVNCIVAGVLALYLLLLQPTSDRLHFHMMLYVLSTIMIIGIWI